MSTSPLEHPVDAAPLGSSRKRRRVIDRMFLAVAGAIAAKSIAVGVATVGISAWWIALPTAVAAALLISSPALVVTGRLRLVVLLVVDVIATVIFVTDTVFYKWYSTIPPLPMLSQTGQLGGVSDTVFGLFSPGSALLVVDLVVIVILIVRGERQPAPSSGRRAARPARHPVVGSGRTAVWVAGLSALLLALIGVIVPRTDLMDRHVDRGLARTVSPLPYHLFDLVLTPLGVKNPPVEKRTLTTWLEDHRADSKPSELFGKAEGSNVLIVQMEAMQNFVVGREIDGQAITPTLNRLIGESIYASSAFSPIGAGNTSDAELMTLTSLNPDRARSAFIGRASNDFPGTLPTILHEAGYRTEAFHGYDKEYYNRVGAYEALGFDDFHSQDDYNVDERIGIGISDASFYRQTADMMTDLDGPWFAHVVTLSGHHPYEIPKDQKPLRITSEGWSKEFTNYLQAQAYADRALGDFLDDLDDRGLLDDTLVVIYGDHWGQGWTDDDLARLVGRSGTDYVDQMEDRRIPLFVRLPGGSVEKRVTTTAALIDVTPTVLDLLGSQAEGFWFGHSILTGSELIVQRFYQPEGSFISDDQVFQAGPDKGLDDGACFARTSHQRLDVKECADGYDEATWRLHASDSILEGDLLPSLLSADPSTD